MKRCSGILIGSCFAWAVIGPAEAQIMLPGALPPPAAGQPGAPGQPPVPVQGQPGLPGAPAKPALPPASQAPGDDTVVSRALQRNGRIGVLALERGAGKSLAISRLVLVGYQISRPAEACRVEISGGKIEVKAAGRYQGLASYDVGMEACPFSFDVLEGAIRVRGEVCAITAADCRVDPTGVWGPPGTSIKPEEAKAIETLRGRAETESRASFRALLANASKDRNKVKDIARDQAGFSSLREETCRDYADEDRHGFCASRITQAHAVALSAALHPEANATAAKPKPKPKPKPVAIPAAEGLQ